MAGMDDSKLEQLRELCEQYATKRGYTLGKRLGYGGSAAVFRVNTGKRDIAVKVYDPSFLTGEGGPAERRRVELQKGLAGHKCQSLVQILGAEYESETCFIEMQFFPWNDLSKELANVPRSEIYSLIDQLVVAARFLEDAGLVHRDIKPANILISPDFKYLVVIDLGVVREWSSDEESVDATDHGSRRPFIATNQYSSPEYLFRTEAPSPDLWKALTLYQVGGVLHDLLAKKPLFGEFAETGNRYVVAFAVQQITPNFDAVQDVPGHLKGVALRCLSKDPKRRMKIVDWADFLPPSSEIESLQKRLQSLTAAHSKQHAIQQEQLQSELKQKEFCSQLLGRIEGFLKDFFQEVTLEVVTLDPAGQFVLRWHFSPLSWVMDLSVGTAWRHEGSLGTVGEITLSAKLARSTTKPAFQKGIILFACGDPNAGVEEAAQIAAEKSCDYLSKALSLLEQGEPIQEIQIGG